MTLTIACDYLRFVECISMPCKPVQGDWRLHWSELYFCHNCRQGQTCFLGSVYHRQSIVAACSADSAPVLEQEIAELQRIIDHKSPQYDSDDPLDLGEACWLAHWFPEEEWSQVC